MQNDVFESMKYIAFLVKMYGYNENSKIKTINEYYSTATITRYILTFHSESMIYVF